jgi:hypothetical protein
MSLRFRRPTSSAGATGASSASTSRCATRIASVRSSPSPPTPSPPAWSKRREKYDLRRLYHRAGHEYAEHSATPKEYDAFVDQISRMWADQPNWTDDQLKAIDTPIVVVDGDHPVRRAADPAECEPFRLLAGPRPVQFRHPAFLGRRIETNPSTGPIWQAPSKALTIARQLLDKVDRL